MRIIQAEQIAQAVCEMCVRASTRLPGDIKVRIAFAEAHRALALGVRHTGLPRRKLETCRTDRPPICQDTGLVCVFLEVEDQAHIDGNLVCASNESVRRGYREGLRKSVARDPLGRMNTGNKTRMHVCPNSWIQDCLV